MLLSHHLLWSRLALNLSIMSLDKLLNLEHAGISLL